MNFDAIAKNCYRMCKKALIYESFRAVCLSLILHPGSAAMLMLMLLLPIIAAVHNMLLSCLPRHNSYL